MELTERLWKKILPHLADGIFHPLNVQQKRKTAPVAPDISEVNRNRKLVWPGIHSELRSELSNAYHAIPNIPYDLFIFY